MADFSEAQERLLKYGIAGFLDIAPNEIQIIKKEEGSVKVTMKLPASAAESLIKAHQDESAALKESLRPLSPQLIELSKSSEVGGESLPERVDGQRSAEEIKLSIEQAIENFRKGVDREEAFEAIYIAYSPPLVEFFKPRVLSDDLARELVQDTFLRVYRNLTKYSGKGDFQTWMLSIARRVYSASVRQDRRARKATGVMEESSADLSKKGERLREALAELPHEMRSAVMFRIDNELTMREIATALQIPSSTVATRFAAIKDKLKAMLGEHTLPNISRLTKEG